MYIAETFFRHKATWDSLKEKLEDFGKNAGLFDEIYIRPLGKRGSDPFQLQVRRFGNRLMGPRRNLIDVGYGREPSAAGHHRVTAPRLSSNVPTAAARDPSAPERPGSSWQPLLRRRYEGQAIDSRDAQRSPHGPHTHGCPNSETALKPEDVSILFFERDELDVRIHSLGIDDQGNITGAPPSYRSFFMHEVRRSLWKHSKHS